MTLAISEEKAALKVSTFYLDVRPASGGLLALGRNAMAVTGSLTDEAGTCNGGPGGCALANVKPYDASERENGNDWPPFGHTMVGHKRLWNVNMTLRTVFANNVPGDFVELGVWRGGVCIYAKAMINMFAQKKPRSACV